MAIDYVSKWEECLVLIKDNIGAARFDTWFKCAEPVSFENNQLTLRIPSMFYYEKYEDDFLSILVAALRRVFGPGVKLGYEVAIVKDDNKSRIKLDSPLQAHVLKNKLSSSYQNKPIENREIDFDPQLNPSLNFENYCLGESNRLPVTIAEHIANNPGNHEFNPFFLYGNVGVGKTHLIQAIGIRIKERNPNARVLFIPMRQFQTLYQQSYLNKDIPAFINWFQQMDVILFDDLQELTNKTGTAEALFPIFNHLQQNKKNIIFTCDRPPMELDGIADRLIDRFKWGITEPLPNPDFNLRKNIIQFKAKKNGLEIPEEVIDYIAACCEGSVRELETVVMGLYSRSIVYNVPLSLNLAKEVIGNVVKTKKPKLINFEMIVETTAEYYNLNPDAIFSKNRLRNIADARQLIMYLSKKHTSLSLKTIGHKLNRAHTTVMHGITSVEDRIPYLKELSDAIAAIEEELMK